MYFQCLIDKEPIPAPSDATGRFQFVYVKDIAEALMASLGNAAVHGGVFNLAAPEIFTYDRWLEALENMHDGPVPTQPVTVAEVYEYNLPLPFPLDSDELFDGRKVLSVLPITYTPFAAGMRETYDVYMRSFGGQSGE